jgi:ABC-2 type transport system ATP-binding protein
VLEFDDATERLGPLAARDECTFAARPGRLTGFLGPNGAGKGLYPRMRVRDQLVYLEPRPSRSR